MNIIGQKNLREKIDSYTKFPRFTILVGERGSGRKLMCRYIAEHIGAQCVFVGTGVDDIRQMIHTANRADMKTLYVIADADNMSAAAKNTLLKVTEESPNNAYIIMTVVSDLNTLATLRSRATTLYMDSYTDSDLSIYYAENYPNGTERDIFRYFASTPGDINAIAGRADEFYRYVREVVENIGEVSDSNVFKIGAKLKLKESDEGKYDLNLFWRAFKSETFYRSYTEEQIHNDGMSSKYLKCALCTAEYLKDLRITGINKSMALDMWIIDIRRILWT